MASSKDYLNYVLEQLNELEGLAYRPMMGEYILYYRNVVVGGVYDDRLLLKPTKSAKTLMPDARFELPYQGAKEMLLADVDDRSVVCRAIVSIADDLTSMQKEKKMFDVLEGKLIRLRKARIGDHLSMLENVWSDESVYKWMLFAPTFTEDEAIKRCERSIEFQKNRFAYFIADKTDDKAVGFCAVAETECGRYEECGICIGARYQGRGYGKETLSLLLKLAFVELNAKDFRYGYFNDNEKSKKLADRFGFVYDKTFEITREWDAVKKTIISCVLTREKYFEKIRDSI